MPIQNPSDKFWSYGSVVGGGIASKYTATQINKDKFWNYGIPHRYVYKASVVAVKTRFQVIFID